MSQNILRREGGADRRSVLKLSSALVASTALAGSMVAGGWPDVTKAATTHSFAFDVQEVGDQLAYNGKIPGVMITASPDDTIDVHLINNLSATDPDDDCGDHNSQHGLHTTNLHTHGLHVSPNTNSSGKFEADNIFLKIVTEGQQVSCFGLDFRRKEAHYRFELPADHLSGTFWYHAHKHGSTFFQVSADLAGPLRS